jgi:hypothetical protein
VELLVVGAVQRLRQVWPGRRERAVDTSVRQSRVHRILLYNYVSFPDANLCPTRSECFQRVQLSSEFGSEAKFYMLPARWKYSIRFEHEFASVKVALYTQALQL